MTTPALRIEGVSKGFGKDAQVVQALDLTLPRGVICSILGPSGCGKTTTLRLIAGLERPDAGAIWIDGLRVCGSGTWVAPEQRNVGMVFQDYALFPHLTVGANIAFGLAGWQAPVRRQRVRKMLEIAGLAEKEHRFPHELSGGQQQRVALARALAPQPALVLLDEPFSNLDANLRSEMRREVEDLLRRVASTAIFVTHDQQEALALSDWVIVMRDGRIEQADRPRHVFRHPASRFVADFLGRANLLPASLGPRPGTLETALGLLSVSQQEMAHAIPPGAPHDDLWVAVRPEELEVLPPASSPEAVKAVIQDVSYLGAEWEVTVKPVAPGPGKTPGWSPVLRVHLRDAKSLGIPTPGDQIGLRIGAFQVLPD